MVKPELGTKRVCPETGRKFYDLNRDPIVSPYTGTSYPLSAFQETSVKIAEDEDDEADDTELDTEDSAELVTLEEAEEETTTTKGKGEQLPDIDVTDDDVDLGDDEDDTFLPDDEEDEEDDVSGILGGVNGEDEEG